MKNRVRLFAYILVIFQLLSCFTPLGVKADEGDGTVVETQTNTSIQAVSGSGMEVHVHSWTTKNVPATCTEQGRTYEECECGKVQNETLLPLAEHEWGSPYIQGDGRIVCECNVCGTLELLSDPEHACHITDTAVYINMKWSVSYNLTFSVTNVGLKSATERGYICYKNSFLEGVPYGVTE